MEKIEILDDEEKRDIDCIQLYNHEIDSIDRLTEEEEKEIIDRVLEGDKEAKQKLVEANLRLVRHIIRKHFYDSPVPFQDLIQEGNIALIKAADGFKKEPGAKFSTYAYRSIKESLKRSVSMLCSQIRVPLHTQDDANRYGKNVGKLRQEIKHEPNMYEISEGLKMPLEKVEYYEKLRQEPVSLNSSISFEEDSAELLDVVGDPNVNVSADAVKNILKDEIEILVNHSRLTQIERYVIIYRMGLFDMPRLTLDAIGKKVNLSRETIRCAEGRALLKIIASKYFTYECELSGANALAFENKRKAAIARFITSSDDDISIKGKTIYELFYSYSKNEVNVMISSLDDGEIDLLHTRYGDDFNKEFQHNMTNEEKYLFYNHLYPKMRKILRTNREENIKNGYGGEYNKVRLNTKEIRFLVSLQHNMNANDYVLFIELVNELKRGAFANAKVPLIGVFILKYGLMNDRTYNFNEISALLNLNFEQVNNLYKKINLLYLDVVQEYTKAKTYLLKK